MITFSMEQLLFHSGGNNLSEYFSNSNGVSFWYFRLYRVTLCFEHFEHFQTLSDYTELLFASNTSNTFQHFQIIQSYSLLRTLSLKGILLCNPCCYSQTFCQNIVIIDCVQVHNYYLIKKVLIGKATGIKKSIFFQLCVFLFLNYNNYKHCKFEK